MKGERGRERADEPGGWGREGQVGRMACGPASGDGWEVLRLRRKKKGRRMMEYIVLTVDQAPEHRELTFKK